MSATFKKSLKAGRKAHKERSQPYRRRKLGLLEKGKDWKLRRDDFHFKEKRIKSMHEKARNKNPDEFYFAMTKTTMKDGIHRLEREGPVYSEEELKLLRTQDLNYLNARRSQERIKIDKLQGELHLMGMDSIAEETVTPKHTIFVKRKDTVDKFDPAKFFQTDPELVDRTFNRPKLSTLEKLKPEDLPKPSTLKKLNNRKKKSYQELAQRLGRLETLDKLASELELKRNLQGKGKRVKVKPGSADAPPVYRWRRERKR
eukprot:m.69491 g.69491  ORF g.69491 m.69491 type:complete len:258 (+) comp12058_c0_seq4:279-1052(+)